MKKEEPKENRDKQKTDDPIDDWTDNLEELRKRRKYDEHSRGSIHGQKTT